MVTMASLASGKPDSLHGGKMYKSPKLERYGTFRELTLGGGLVTVDGFGPTTPTGPIGCLPGPGGANALCLSH
jgi:hypothetical protein